MEFYNENSLGGQQQLELVSDFEPITRARSNTWPLPRPDPLPCSEYTPPPTLHEQEEGNYTGGGGSSGSIGEQHHQQEFSNSTGGESPSTTAGGASAGAPNSAKKSTSRRNAWGNLSYADLITQAITSSPESRLTLSQIYDWMVTNVPYFKDKGDSNSSAGWKNSIRHNLSLHNRFMRVQNEGTGKSSWWMLNPDARPGKAARRRATSMETSKYEKKRGRIKKKLEAMRNGLLSPGLGSSSLSEGLDNYGGGAGDEYSPLSSIPDSHNYRPRTSSNASSIGMTPSSNSRLSPVLDDYPYSQSVGGGGYFTAERYSTAESLVQSLLPMKLQESGGQGGRSPLQQQQQQHNTGGGGFSEFGPNSSSNIGGGPFRSHSFGVGGHGFTRPNIHQLQQQHLINLTGGGGRLIHHHPHSSSMDTLFSPLGGGGGHTLFGNQFGGGAGPGTVPPQNSASSLFNSTDIKTEPQDEDYNLEQLEPSFTANLVDVDDEVLRSEFGEDLLGGEDEFGQFGMVIEEGNQGQQGHLFGGQLNTNYYSNPNQANLQSLQQPGGGAQSPQAAGASSSSSQQQANSRQWVH